MTVEYAECEFYGLCNQDAVYMVKYLDSYRRTTARCCKACAKEALGGDDPDESLEARRLYLYEQVVGADGRQQTLEDVVE
jgi:hypothetical protein